MYRNERKYNMDVKSRFERLVDLVVDRRKELDSFLDFLRKETVYFSTPASTRFHLCREGGLLEHSINVAETMLRLKGVLAPEVSDESCVIVALFHDLGKAGMPGNPQYLKNEPSDKQKVYGYEPKYPYSFNNKLTYLSVPVRSLYLVLQYLPLSEEEVQAIVYHDGQYVEDNRGVATKEEKLTLLLQYSDNWSGFILEKEEK